MSRATDAGHDHVGALALTARAIRERWAIPDHVRLATVDACAKIVADPNATRYHQLAAARTLAILDSINVRDESNRIQKRGNELAAGQAALKEAMRSPAGREALAQLSQVACNPLPLPKPDAHCMDAHPPLTNEGGSDGAPISNRGVGDDGADVQVEQGDGWASYGADRD